MITLTVITFIMTTEPKKNYFLPSPSMEATRFFKADSVSKNKITKNKWWICQTKNGIFLYTENNNLLHCKLLCGRYSKSIFNTDNVLHVFQTFGMEMFFTKNLMFQSLDL